jgi:ATP-dependent Clp protease ATP-binding subunit ClpC
LGFELKLDKDAEERMAYEDMRKKLTDALNKSFRPEFINRVDSIIVFHALTKEQIAEIVDLELAKVTERLRENQIYLRITDQGRALLAELGYDPEMGARPLRREIQNRVEDQLSDALLAGSFKDGDRILVDDEDGEIVLKLDETEEEGEKPEVIAAG